MEGSRREFLKDMALASGLALTGAESMLGKEKKEEKEVTLEKLELSWSTQNGKAPIDSKIQEAIAKNFSEIANIVWREPNLGSARPDQIQFIVVPNFLDDDLLSVHGVQLPKNREDFVACTPKETGDNRVDNRIFVSVDAVKRELKKDGLPINATMVNTAIAQAATHEIIHLFLGTSHPHDKKGLFAAKMHYGAKLDPQTREELVRKIKERKSSLKVSEKP